MISGFIRIDDILARGGDVHRQVIITELEPRHLHGISNSHIKDMLSKSIDLVEWIAVITKGFIPQLDAAVAGRVVYVRENESQGGRAAFPWGRPIVVAHEQVFTDGHVLKKHFGIFQCIFVGRGQCVKGCNTIDADDEFRITAASARSASGAT